MIEVIIKICGIKNLKELQIIEKYADATGIILKSNSKRCIPLETAREIIQNATIPVFAVSTSSNLDVWLKIVSKTECDFVQVHSEYINAEILDCLKEHVRVMKAFIVTDDRIEREVPRITKQIVNLKPHLILIDSGCGTGKVHNWEISREIAKKYPIFLAGGLKLGNVVQAVKTVKPAGLDVSSGVEVNGFKEEDLVREFVRKVREIKGYQRDKNEIR